MMLQSNKTICSRLGRACAIGALVFATLPSCAQGWMISSVFPARSPSLLNQFGDPFGHSSLSLTPRSMLNTMHQLERETDRLMSTLLEEEADVHTGQNVSDTSDFKESSLATKAAAFDLKLRPSFSIEDNSDAFMLTAATPGLSKENLAVDVLDGADGAAYLIISGNTASSAPGQNSDSASTDTSPSEAPEMKMKVKVTYRFERKIKLPPSVDRTTMKASYDQGLLTITIPKHAKPQQLKLRVPIA
jgi:HSP20 family molecular chaperone IbpA